MAGGRAVQTEKSKQGGTSKSDQTRKLKKDFRKLSDAPREKREKEYGPGVEEKADQLLDELREEELSDELESQETEELTDIGEPETDEELEPEPEEESDHTEEDAAVESDQVEEAALDKLKDPENAKDQQLADELKQQKPEEKDREAEPDSDVEADLESDSDEDLDSDIDFSFEGLDGGDLEPDEELQEETVVPGATVVAEELAEPEEELIAQEPEAKPVTEQQKKLRSKVYRVKGKALTAQEQQEQEKLIQKKIDQLLAPRDTDQASEPGEASDVFSLLNVYDVTLTPVKRLHMAQNNLRDLEDITIQTDTALRTTWRGIMSIRAKRAVLLAELTKLEGGKAEPTEEPQAALPQDETVEDAEEEVEEAQELLDQNLEAEQPEAVPVQAAVPAKLTGRKRVEARRTAKKQSRLDARKVMLQVMLAEAQTMEQEKLDRLEQVLRPRMQWAKKATEEQADVMNQNAMKIHETLLSDLRDSKGDLGAHQLTGLGPAAKHESEMNQEKKQSYDENEETAGFQKSVVRQVQERLDRKIQKKQEKLAEQYSTKTVEEILGPMLKGETLADQEDLVDVARKGISDYRQKIDASRKNIGALWTRARELSGQQEVLEALLVQQRDLRDKEIKKQKATMDEKGRVASASGRLGAWKVSRLINKVKDLENKIDAIKGQLDEIDETLKDSRMEQQAMRLQEGALHGVKLAAKLRVLETRKANAEEDVQNADVLQIADPDYDEANTHKGIYMDGKLYLEGETPDEAVALDEENETQMGEKYDLEEARLQAEEQKVVQGLKRSPVFQMLNSENVMEYVTYSEELGVFDLQELPGNVDPSVLKEQIRQLQKQREESEVNDEIDPLLQDTEELDQKPQEELQEIARAYYRQQATENYRQNSDTAYAKEQKGSRKHNMKLYWHGNDHLMDDPARMLLGLGLKVAGDFTGVGSFLKARDEERMGGSGEADSMTKAAIQGGTQLASPVASAMGILSGVGGMGAAASAFGIGKGIAEAVLARGDRERAQKQDEILREKRQNRMSRITRQYATEKKIQEAGGYMDAINGAVGLALKATGFGTIISLMPTVISALVKTIFGAVERRRMTASILNSKDILGGVKYDEKLIPEKHFNKILGNVTGFNNKKGVFNALRIVDSIDLHRAIRAANFIHQSGMKNVEALPELDGVMSGLGLAADESGAYGNIRLSDIQKKMGYTGFNWRKDLRRSVEIEGVDYATARSRMVTATRKKDHYQEKAGRLSRQDELQKRFRKNSEEVHKEQEKDQEHQEKVRAHLTQKYQKQEAAAAKKKQKLQAKAAKQEQQDPEKLLDASIQQEPLPTAEVEPMPAAAPVQEAPPEPQAVPAAANEKEPVLQAPAEKQEAEAALKKAQKTAAKVDTPSVEVVEADAKKKAAEAAKVAEGDLLQQLLKQKADQ